LFVAYELLFSAKNIKEISMRKVALLLACVLAVAAPASAKNLDYVVFKAGGYAPQSDDVKNLGVENSFYGELAIGTYFSDNFAVELAGGYTQSTGTFTGAVAGSSFETTLTVMPFTLGVKALYPMSWFEPYAMAGAGAYYVKLESSGSAGVASASGSVDSTALGGFVGAGANFNLGQRFFLGVEGKYIICKPTLNSANIKNQEVDISGGLVTGNIGIRF